MFKKFLTKTASFGMAAIMTASLGMGVASAKQFNTPVDDTRASENDRATISVAGIESGATVIAYQIVEANYNAYGLISYILTEPFGGSTPLDKSDDAIADDKDFYPTEDEITNIASGLYADQYTGVKSYTMKGDATGTNADGTTLYTYSADVPAGTYVVLAKSVKNATGEWVYNPVYVSVGYTDANDKTTLVQKDKLNVNDASYEYTDTDGNKVVGYAKKSYTTLDKDIVNASTGNTETEDVAIGDTVSFKVTSQIPYYSKAFTTIKYEMNDVQEEGLDAPTDFVVMVGDTTLTANKDYTLTITDNDWKIVFAESTIRNNPLKEVTVTYNSVVNEKAVIAGIEETDLDKLSNQNKTTLTYTTVPGETHDYEDSVNLYTFGFIAAKVDNENNEKLLPGAEFLLTRIDENGNTMYKDGKAITYTATSDEDGNVIFNGGLDAGTYTLVETKAPKGYYNSNITYKVEITAEYEADADGSGATITSSRTAYDDEQLTGWSVAITDYNTNAEYASATFDATNLKALDTFKIFDILNTRLAELPTTGGMGTMALTGVAVVLFGTAAYLVFGKKKDEVAE
jgi:fimbrial isopeptide formation D2 family protein/LPXTG-motif cell wall-anchored protein